MSQPFKSYDYVIVGAGTAGCLLANRLSADPNVSVALVEAGGNDHYVWIHIPVGYLYCIGNPRTDWCYRSEPEAGLNGRSILYARGRVLGGCSSINAMLYLRGQALDYDGWAQATGDTSWAWQNVLPIFKKTEDHWRHDQSGGATSDAKDLRAMHGHGGEWRVEQQRLSWEILDAFQNAAAEFGIPKIDDFNSGDNFGSSRFEVNQRRGVRWNAVRAFLNPARQRQNLTIFTKAMVQKIHLQGQRACGIEVLLEGERRYIAARRETILSAGAIGSPQILQLSGIGEGSHLQSLGVPLLHELKAVGENLQDHCQLRMAFKVKNVLTLNTMANSLWGKAMMALEYAFKRTGPLTMAPSQLGAFAKSDPSQTTANIEYHVQPLSLDKFGDPLHTFPAFTASVCNLRPTARGQVRIRTNDPMQAPAIRLNYLSTPEDQRVAVDALRLTRRIVNESLALRSYEPQEFLPGPHLLTDADLVTAAGNIGTTIFHPVGTCKMGREDDERAVVDTQLRVRGLQGLRIVDASVMPNITSGNTNSPTLMIAERGAELIRRSA